jgi:Flp pilus assembly protein TadG
MNARRCLGRLARLARARRGATALEFALIFPALAMVIFGVWYVGFAIYQGGEVRHAVELGSRIYITNPSATLDDLKTAVGSHLLDVPLASVTLGESSQTVGSATNAHITWSYQMTTSIPFMSSIPLNFNGAVDVPEATP